MISNILNLSHTTDHLVELVWSVSPILMLLLISSLSLFYTYELEQGSTGEDYSVNITVIGYQWGWNYEVSEIVISDKFIYISQEGWMYIDPVGNKEFYPAYPIKLWSQWLFDKELQPTVAKMTSSIKPFRYFDWNCSYCIDALEPTKSLVIQHPNYVDKFEDYSSILLSLTRSDVLHSWYVPKLGIKIDAVPGQISKVSILFNNFRSVSYGRCTEVCGPFHSIIPIKVIRLFPNYYSIDENIYYSQQYDLFGVTNPKFTAPWWWPIYTKFAHYQGGYSKYFNRFFALRLRCYDVTNYIWLENIRQGRKIVNYQGARAHYICPQFTTWTFSDSIPYYYHEPNWVFTVHYPVEAYDLLFSGELDRLYDYDDYDKWYDYPLDYWDD